MPPHSPRYASTAVGQLEWQVALSKRSHASRVDAASCSIELPQLDRAAWSAGTRRDWAQRSAKRVIVVATYVFGELYNLALQSLAT